MCTDAVNEKTVYGTAKRLMVELIKKIYKIINSTHLNCMIYLYMFSAKEGDVINLYIARSLFWIWLECHH